MWRKDTHGGIKDIRNSEHKLASLFRQRFGWSDVVGQLKDHLSPNPQST